MYRRKLNPEDMISMLYEGEGFYEVERKTEDILGATSRIIISDGKRELAVNILTEDLITSRGALHDALLQAEKLREKFHGVVIAIPRRFQRAIDEGVLAIHGLGLVIYDNLGAEEVIPPKIKEAEKIGGIEKPISSSSTISEEILMKLRSDISRLMKVIDEMEARLDRLEKGQRRLELEMNKIKEELSKTKQVEAKEELVKPQVIRVEAKKLPSYLVDNPWIEILTKRG